MPIEILGVRKVSAEQKARYKAYLIPCVRCKARYEKTAGSTRQCPACEEITLRSRSSTG